MLHEMKVTGLALDPSNNAPIIILRSEDGQHTLPIWIGILEATSIAMVLQNIEFTRPMTHDLFKGFVETVSAKVERVEVCDLQDNTFYARIYFSLGEKSFNMDARPSDAIAIALRTKAPIFVDQVVITKSSSMDQPGEAADMTEEGKRWTEYLANLSPDDFGKYKM